MQPPPEFVLGRRLRALRESRGLSRPEAERLAGLGAGTLKAWETGSRTPRGPALIGLLNALEANARRRAEAIALADPSHARVALEAYPAGPPLELGALLRAFRRRKGWTQAEAARALGVTQGAVAQWESGERNLKGPALHQALFALGASAEEAAATLSSPHRTEGPEEDPAIVNWTIERVPGALREPFQLANERALWWGAVRQPGLEFFLRAAMVNRAVGYAHMRRFDEIEPLWRRIHRMAPDPGTDTGLNKVAIVLSDVRFRPDASPTRLVRRLEALISRLDHSAERAWARGSLAVGLATLGERRSVGIAQLALEESRRTVNSLHESWNRTVDLAEVHLGLGEPERALDALGDAREGVDHQLWQTDRNPQGLAVRARAIVALSREPDPELLGTLRSFAAADGTPYYQNRLAGVERDLAAMRRGA